MPWPGATDYTTAVQNPEGAFGDAELRASTPECNAFLGLPLSYCGNFAIVYKLLSPTGEAWAVKCFTREVTDHRQRYAAISRHLDRNRKRFAVEFGYLDEGIKVGGNWYPCVKMRWVEGHTLNESGRQDHVAHDITLGFGLAGDAFQSATTDAADTDTSTNSGETGTDNGASFCNSHAGFDFEEDVQEGHL